MSDHTEPVVICGPVTATGKGPYFIGYSDMVDGYRHAYAETDRLGRRKIRTTRNATHPPDPRCPGCLERTKP